MWVGRGERMKSSAWWLVIIKNKFMSFNTMKVVCLNQFLNSKSNKKYEPEDSKDLLDVDFL